MLYADDAIKVGEYLFLFANNINVLFSINLYNGELTFLSSIPEEHIISKGLTCKLMYIKKNIIVVPLLARKIWIYSLESGKWKSISIEDCKVYGRGTYFRQAIRYKDSLFFIGGHYPAILKIDLPSCKLTYLKKPFLNCTKSKELEELYFRGDFVYKEDTLYLASGRNNMVLVYHLDTHNYKWIELGEEGNRYSGIMWDGKNYWLSPRKNTPIIKWDGNGNITEYEIPEEKKVDKIAYAGIIKRNNQIIIPALAGSDADTIILNDDGIMKFDTKRYFFYKKTEEGDYLAQDSNGQVLFINKKGKKKQYGCELSGDSLSNFLDIISKNITDIVAVVNKESESFHLKYLLMLIKKIELNLVQNKRGSALKIWEEINL